MAGTRTKTRYPGIYKTGSGTYEAHVERPRPRGAKRLPPIVETFPKLTGKGGALVWQTSTKEQVRTRTYVDAKTSPTVGEQMRVWQAMQTHHRPATAVIVENTIRLHVEPYPIAAIPLAELTRRDCQAWVNDQATRYAPGTVSSCAGWLRAMLNDAMDGDPPERPPLIPSSPMRRVKVPTPTPRVVRAARVLTVDQVLRLAAAMPEPWQATMLRCQAGTGLRVGELRGLRVRDVDFLRREIHLDTQMGYRAQARTELKTSRSRRVVPLPQWVVDELARHMQPDRFPPLAEHEDLIFYHPARREPVWRSYDAALARTARELHADDPSFPEVTSHDLRHHYVSLLIYQGHSAVAIADRIGDNPARVWDTYAHVWPGSQDDTRQAIDAAYGVTGPRPPRPVAFPLPSAGQDAL